MCPEHQRSSQTQHSTAQPAVCGHTRGIRWRENIGGGWGILCVSPFLRHHSFLLLFSLSRSQKHCLRSFALAINSFIYGFTLHFLHFKRAQEVQRQSALKQQQTRLRPTQCCFSDTLPRGWGGTNGRHGQATSTVRVAPSSSILKYKTSVL